MYINVFLSFCTPHRLIDLQFDPESRVPHRLIDLQFDPESHVFCVAVEATLPLGASHLIPRGGVRVLTLEFCFFSVGGGVLFFFLLRVEYFFFF